MKEGNKTKYQAEGGIGLLSNNLTFQGPIQRNKSSFILSARQSHINLLLKPLTSKTTSYKFYDLNAKKNYGFGTKDHLFISFFKGNDNADYFAANSLNYTGDFGNSTGTLRWNHLFGNKIFSNTSIIYNDYHLALGTEQNSYYSLLYTGIKDISAKSDFTINPNEKHRIKAGFTYTNHTLYPAGLSGRIPRRGNRVIINKDNEIETSVEFYYKKMDYQVLFKEGNQLKINADLDSGLAYGKGESYGAEFFVKKNTGKLTGWISYTLSWTNHTFDDLNFGKQFPFKYDRRHVLSVTTSYQLTGRWSLGAVFAYSSGVAFTLPTGRINSLNAGTIFEGNYYVYEGRNNYRLSPYHRLDLSATHKKIGKIFKKRFEREWTFGVYNDYSRQNPYFVYFQIDALTDKPTASKYRYCQ